MIEFKNVGFSYSDRPPCIHDINLKIWRNECVVLIGRSGCGKTTLTRLINGLAESFYGGTMTGELLIEGNPTAELPQWRRVRQIGSVFQDPKSQFFSGALEEEIAFACENFGVPTAQIREMTKHTIWEMGLEGLRGKPLDIMSSGEKQRVAIASVRVLNPDIYVFDEPTANLDGEASAALADIMCALKASGHTLIVAEHRLSYLLGIADRFVYLDNGRITYSFTPEELKMLPAEERTRLGLRSPVLPELPILPSPGAFQSGASTLAVTRITLRKKKQQILSDVNFSAFRGEIIAITGRNGAGKTSLMRIFCGLERECSGELCLSGRSVAPKRRRNQVWYSANENTQFFTESVSEELMLMSKHTPEVLEQAREFLRLFGLYEWKDAHPTTLSGGQKQRLSIACGLMSGRKVLIFDEPTSGLDGENMMLVSATLRAAAERAKTILIITHDTELIKECCTGCFHISTE